MDLDEKYKREALREAQAAGAEDEVPIGAVVVCRGRIIARGHNMTERYALTRGFWMIPQEQINLQQGLLEQNEGFKDGQSYLFVDGDLPY